MSKTMSMKVGLGVGLLLTGMLAGAGVAYAMQSAGRASFINSGLFTLGPGEAVRFNVTLDDGSLGPPANVLMQLLDQKGNVVARQQVTLDPGQSATLRYRQSGVLRAHAEILEPGSGLGTRRIVVSTIEIFSLSDGAQASVDFGIAIPTRFVCSSDDGGGNGRLPD